MRSSDVRIIKQEFPFPGGYPADHSRPLKIALLGYRSHPHVGGQGVYIKYLSRVLAAQGHHVDVFSGPPYPHLDPAVTLVKVPSLDLYSVMPKHIRALRPRHLLSWSDFFEWWSMATGGFAEPYTFGRRLLKTQLTTDRYDVVHDNQSLNYALLKMQSMGTRVVATVHHPINRDLELALQDAPDWGHRLLVKRWYSFLAMQEKVAQRLTHVVTVSKTSQQDICNYWQMDSASIQVIPNGVDTQLFCPRPEILRRPLRILTTTSSDQPLKGFASLLHALLRVREVFGDVHLRVIGQLKPDGRNQCLLRDLGLDGCVSFRSQLSDTALSEEYAKAQVAVCPSLYEGFGLPAIEAMASGVPLVCSDGGALREVVGEGGHLFPAGCSTSMADGILRVLSDPSYADELTLRGLRRVQKRYSWDAVGEQMVTYYRRMISAFSGEVGLSV